MAIELITTDGIFALDGSQANARAGSNPIR